jgi:hypothetical protein
MSDATRRGMVSVFPRAGAGDDLRIGAAVVDEPFLLKRERDHLLEKCR